MYTAALGAGNITYSLVVELTDDNEVLPATSVYVVSITVPGIYVASASASANSTASNSTETSEEEAAAAAAFDFLN